MRQWRLIYDRPTRGVRNMAVDEVLLGSEIPTLRLYAWQPYCLSLGYGQRAADVDLARLAASGWDLVRRPSGGRAILHAEELTYCLTLPAEHPLAQGGVIATYRRISRALLRALTELGAGVESAAADTERGRAQKDPVCFEIPSHYEITAQGRKLVGSAQIRREKGVLQHGSIPIRGDLGQICEVLGYPDATQREVAKQQVRGRAITLAEALGDESISWEQVAEAIAAAVSAVFEVELCRDALSNKEMAAVDSLAERVYDSREWTLRR